MRTFVKNFVYVFSAIALQQKTYKSFGKLSGSHMKESCVVCFNRFVDSALQRGVLRVPVISFDEDTEGGGGKRKSTPHFPGLMIGRETGLFR